jgi:hypothetical protein
MSDTSHYLGLCLVVIVTRTFAKSFQTGRITKIFVELRCCQVSLMSLLEIRYYQV